MNIRTFHAAFVGTLVAAVSSSRVHFTDIKALTLRKGAYTNFRRLGPVPQLKCVGGPCSDFPLETVQCRNVGHDGQLPQWECKAADLSNQVQLHTHDVVCEGYSRAGDPYVLYGSCGLEYSLKRVGGQHAPPRANFGANSYPHSHSGGGWGTFIAIAGCFLAALFLLSLYQPQHYHAPQGGDYCHSSGSAYSRYLRPAYGSSFYHQPSGFWTGAGLGSLAGYWAGSGNNSHNRRSYSSSGQGGGLSSWSSSSGGWGGSRTATSFAGSRSR